MDGEPFEDTRGGTTGDATGGGATGGGGAARLFELREPPVSAGAGTFPREDDTAGQRQPVGERRSTVEMWRSGELSQFPYDLSDPCHYAIYRVVQLYVDYAEAELIRMAGALGGPGAAAKPAAGAARAMGLAEEGAALLEEALSRIDAARRRLAEHSPAGTSFPPERASLSDAEDGRLFSASLRAAALMSSSEAGRPAASASVDARSFTIPRSLWLEGASLLPSGLASSGPRDQKKTSAAGLAEGGGIAMSGVPLALYGPVFAPFSALLRWGLGPLVSQSEAARALGVTAKALKDTLAMDSGSGQSAGEGAGRKAAPGRPRRVRAVDHVRVEGHVLVRERSLQKRLEERP